MIKGAKRSVVVLKNTGSELFEEAHFLLRNGRDKEADEGDILSEANRVIETNSLSLASSDGKKEKRSRKARDTLIFILGFISSALIFGLILLLI